jgi:hypothetical protein
MNLSWFGSSTWPKEGVKVGGGISTILFFIFSFIML